MREGTTFTLEELREAAVDAVGASEKAQSDVARELGVHRSSVSRALNEAGERYQGLQRRIIANVTPYEIERQLLFKARRKDT